MPCSLELISSTYQTWYNIFLSQRNNISRSRTTHECNARSNDHKFYQRHYIIGALAKFPESRHNVNLNSHVGRNLYPEGLTPIPKQFLSRFIDLR
jgi:hypothetical protein